MQVPVSQIVVGNNPRRFMDADELEELTRSIRSVGIIQPITVKRGNEAGQFIVVAGHRRLKAAKEAGLNEIPVHVIENDEDADAMALIENTVRVDMSAAEESDAAMSMLNKNKGDMKEVALILGWTEGKLRRRVALNACSNDVREALAERRIKLGIAELLATVPEHKNQDKALTAIIERDMTVEQVRQLLLKLVQKLDKAIFDKTECADCKFNTGLQKTLFEETISDDAFCTNGTCYAKKTTEAVSAKAESLQTDYATVRIVHLGDAENWTKLQAGGPDGVGAEQCEKCASCAHFGATVSSIVGEEGTVEESLCFDLPCHEAMVEAEHKQPEEMRTETSEAGETESDANEKAKTTEHTASAGKSAEPKAKRPEVALSSAVRDYRRSVWNNAALKHLAKSSGDEAKTLIVALIACRKNGDFDCGKVESVCERSIDGFNGQQRTVGNVAELLESKHDKLLTVCAGSAIEKTSEVDVQSILKYLKVDLSEHWMIDGEYLGLMTKTEISAVVKAFNLEEKIKDWSKIHKGKKGEIIDAVMKSGIDFNGMIPLNIKY